MAEIILKNISKRYDNDFVAVKNFNLHINDMEFIVFVGPSGCGKTTTLRMIAGLENISQGELIIDGKLLNDVAPKDRDIAMVFQNYALYPHMSVYNNMAFSLKLRKIPKNIIDNKVKEVAKTLDIYDLLKRKPKALSGGQRQRVAMGRAIVREPKVFLMDEPLSNLDAKLRVQMRTEIAKLHKSLKATFIYVTHDQTEAMTLGTRIVVMKDGVVQQIGTPQEIYYNPANRFVAGFIGSPQMNLLEGYVEKKEDYVFVRVGKNNIKLPEYNAEVLDNKGYIGKQVTLGIRPEDVLILPVKNNQSNVFDAEVEVKEHLGAEIYLYLNMDELNIVGRVDSRIDAEVGEVLKITFNSDRMYLFDKETERIIN